MTSTLAAVAFFLLGLFEKFSGRSVSAWVLVCLAVPLFWIGAIVAWLKKRRELETEKAKNVVPSFNARILAAFVGPIAFCDNRTEPPTLHARPFDALLLLRIHAWNEVNMTAAPSGCIVRLMVDGQPVHAGATSLDNIPSLPPVFCGPDKPGVGHMGLSIQRYPLIRPLQYQVPILEQLLFFMEGMRSDEFSEDAEVEIELEFAHFGKGTSVVKATKHRLIQGQLRCGDFR